MLDTDMRSRKEPDAQARVRQCLVEANADTGVGSTRVAERDRIDRDPEPFEYLPDPRPNLLLYCVLCRPTDRLARKRAHDNAKLL